MQRMCTKSTEQRSGEKLSFQDSPAIELESSGKKEARIDIDISLTSSVCCVLKGI